MKIVISILFILLLALLAATYWIFYFVSCRHIRQPKPHLAPDLEPYRNSMNENVLWFQSQEPETVVIPTGDGVPLSGLYLERKESLGTVICFHDYRSTPYIDFSSLLRFYYGQGYSVLAVYQRGHGESGGDYVTLGAKERFDCRDWARYIYDRFGPDHDIFLDGVGMGAAAVLMSTTTQLPETVRGLIADSSYTSPWDMVLTLFQRHRIPRIPFAPLIELLAKILGGFSYRDYSTPEAMRLSIIPVLFFHGEADAVIPSEFTRKSYDTCRAEKILYTVPNVGHAACSVVDEQQYCKLLARFLYRHSTAAHPVSAAQSA